MLNTFNNFINDETGAVTVDWVVLTAALVGLGLAVMSVVGDGVGELSNNMADSLSTTNVGGVTFDRTGTTPAPAPEPAPGT